MSSIWKHQAEYHDREMRTWDDFYEGFDLTDAQLRAVELMHSMHNKREQDVSALLKPAIDKMLAERYGDKHE